MTSESGEQSVEIPPSGGVSPTTHRWNPTKEQITMLENLYKQGIRTPSAEQIQQITSRLKVHGHIEGKNVFYWFQNHKARQRQKQKQDHMATYFNRNYLPQPPPFLPPPSPNVVCSPYYMPPPSDLGFYPAPQCPKLILPSSRKRSPRKPQMMMMMMNEPDQKPISPCCDEREFAGGDSRFNCMPPPPPRRPPPLYNTNNVHQETLALFPLHPTGVLRERRTEEVNYSSSFSNIASIHSSSCSVEITSNAYITTTPSEATTDGMFSRQEAAGGCGTGGDQCFFDFFCSGSNASSDHGP